MAATHWLIKCFVSAGFVGYIPIASGTFGTVVGVLLYLPVRSSVLLQAGLALALLVPSIPLCTRAEQLFQQKDSGRIVIDEVLGFLITMLGIAVTSWWVLVVAFFLNRACDIYKPYPIRKLERLPGGWGIMLDDVGAGIYSNLLLRVILIFFA